MIYTAIFSIEMLSSVIYYTLHFSHYSCTPINFLYFLSPVLHLVRWKKAIFFFLLGIKSMHKSTPLFFQ